jgi:hypothetical protein
MYFVRIIAAGKLQIRIFFRNEKTRFVSIRVRCAHAMHNIRFEFNSHFSARHVRHKVESRIRRVESRVHGSLREGSKL